MKAVDHGSVFAAYRSDMLAAAFHITGSRDDAEDVVQDAWESWSRVDIDAVRTPRTFLSVMVSRLALNALRAQRRRRESYLGPWVPDPVVDDGSPEWSALHRDGLGQALDFVLATLSAEQATAYVLRKVLDVDYAGIADALETTPAAARQLVSRAQRAVTAAIGATRPGQRASDARALAALADAVLTGDVEKVAALLAPDAILYSDGGGKARAARRPVLGAEKVARFLLGLAESPGLRMVPVTINGSAGLLVREHGQITTTVTVRDGAAGILALYFVRNPDKLAPLAARQADHREPDAMP